MNGAPSSQTIDAIDTRINDISDCQVLRATRDKFTGQKRRRRGQARKRITLGEEEYLSALRQSFSVIFSHLFVFKITAASKFTILCILDHCYNSSEALNIDSQIHNSVSVPSNLTLEGFFRRYQSDDNASFGALLEREAQEHLVQKVQNRLQQAACDPSLPSSRQSTNLLLKNQEGTRAKDLDGESDHDESIRVLSRSIRTGTNDQAFRQPVIRHKLVNYNNTGFNHGHQSSSNSHSSSAIMGPPQPLSLPPGALQQNLRPYSYVMTPIGSDLRMTKGATATGKEYLGGAPATGLYLCPWGGRGTDQQHKGAQAFSP